MTKKHAECKRKRDEGDPKRDQCKMRRSAGRKVRKRVA